MKQRIDIQFVMRNSQFVIVGAAFRRPTGCNISDGTGNPSPTNPKPKGNTHFEHIYIKNGGNLYEQ